MTLTVGVGGGAGGGRAEETLLLVSLYFFGKIGGAKAPSAPPAPPSLVVTFGAFFIFRNISRLKNAKAKAKDSGNGSGSKSPNCNYTGEDPENSETGGRKMSRRERNITPYPQHISDWHLWAD